jgi:RNA polymerase sigma-70 factor (ECF subfamily)
MGTTNAQGTRTASNDDPFCPTRWSIVLAARGPDSARGTAALEQLCSSYWHPLYSYIRRRGHSPEDAQDLTQTFFARLLEKRWLDAVAPEKGRFRAFLLAAVKHFLANEWDRSQAQKRGGGVVHVSMDAETRYLREPADQLTPERLFDRQWALALLETVLTKLSAQHDTADKHRLFEALRDTLTGDQPENGYAELGRTLGLTEGAVKVAVHRLRKRYRELLRAEIAQTVSDPAQVGDELRALFRAFQE